MPKPNESYPGMRINGSGHAEESDGCELEGGIGDRPQGGASQLSMYEADALTSLERAQGIASAFEKQINAAALALDAAKSKAVSDCEKVFALHRLVTARLELVRRRLVEGR